MNEYDDRGILVYDLKDATEIDLGYTVDNPLGDAYGNFWDAVNPLPVGSVVAAGWTDALAYWRKDSTTDFQFTLVHVTGDNDDEDLVVGYVENQDPNTLACGGDIEKAYIIKPREEF